MTSSPLRHEETSQNNVTKIFPIWAGPFQSKFLATPEVLG